MLNIWSMDVETWHQPVLLSSWRGSDNGLSTASKAAEQSTMFILVRAEQNSTANKAVLGRAEQNTLPAEATDESEEALKIGAEGS